MKFKEELTENLDETETELKKQSISYKNYKKTSKGAFFSIKNIDFEISEYNGEYNIYYPEDTNINITGDFSSIKKLITKLPN